MLLDYDGGISMILIHKKRNYKYGSSSIFLSIILSAVILVNSVFLSKVIEINRKMKTAEALKLQIEQILASYNEDLYEVYGILGFSEDEVNLNVYQDVIGSCGYSFDGNIVTVNDFYDFDEERLRDAIVQYYTLRAPAAVFSDVSYEIKALIDEYDRMGIADKVSSYLKGNNGKIISDIFNGITDLSEYTDDIEFIDSMGYSSDTVDAFLELIRDETEFDLSSLNDFFNLSMSDTLGEGLLNGAYDINETFSAVGDTLLYPMYLNHYAAYNFDCVFEEFHESENESFEDVSFNGTSFTEIHGSNQCDLEYILTGIEGEGALLVITPIIHKLLLIEEFLVAITNEKLMKVLKICGEIMYIIMSLCDCPIPAEVWTYIFAYRWAQGGCDSKTILIMSGNYIDIFDFESLPEPLNKGLHVNYRDILYGLLAFIPNDYKEERICEILNRDYDDFYCGIELKSTYMNSNYYFSESYALYN